MGDNSRNSRSYFKYATTRGFSLLELMVALTIVAILTATAVPSYISHVQKTRRVEGVSVLLELSVLMERYYANNGTYKTATVVGLHGSAGSENGYYSLAINPLADESYTLLAAPANNQLGDSCGTLALNSLGIRSVAGGSLPASDCWH